MDEDSRLDRILECSRLREAHKIRRLNCQDYRLFALLSMIQDSLQIYSLDTRLSNCQNILVTDAIVFSVARIIFSYNRKNHAGSVTDIHVVHRNKHIHREEFLRTYFWNGEHHSDILSRLLSIDICGDPCRLKLLLLDCDDLDLS